MIDTPVASVSLNLPLPQPFTAPVLPPPVINHRPRILTFLLVLLTGAFIYRTIAAIIGISILLSSSNSNHLLTPLFFIIPTLTITPVLFALLASCFLYLLFKTANPSSDNYKLLSITLIVIPVFFSLLVFTTLYSSELVLPATERVINFPKLLLSALVNEVNIFSLLIFIVLKKNSHLFTNPSTSITTIQKTIFVLLTLLFLIPSILLTFMTIYTSFNPDTNFTHMQNLIGHKLYQPAYLPQKLKLATQYYEDEKNTLKLANPTIKVAFDLPAFSRTENIKSKMIILNQSVVQPGFDLLAYFHKELPDRNPEKVDLSFASDKSAYLFLPTSDSRGTLEVKSLYFVTADNLFVHLITPSPQINARDLLDIAESLK